MYIFEAHPTMYEGVRFRSRLEARWAVLFDYAGWTWEYEPFDLKGWTPDFLAMFPCHKLDCPEHHSLLIEVKPYTSVEQFEGHPCMDFPYGEKWDSDERIPADASAAFGNNPDVTHWEMVCGDGAAWYNIDYWVPNVWDLWVLAGNIVQWKGPTNERC